MRYNLLSKTNLIKFISCLLGEDHSTDGDLGECSATKDFVGSLRLASQTRR